MPSIPTWLLGILTLLLTIGFVYILIKPNKKQSGLERTMTILTFFIGLFSFFSFFLASGDFVSDTTFQIILYILVGFMMVWLIGMIFLGYRKNGMPFLASLTSFKKEEVYMKAAYPDAKYQKLYQTQVLLRKIRIWSTLTVLILIVILFIIGKYS